MINLRKIQSNRKYIHFRKFVSKWSLVISIVFVLILIAINLLHNGNFESFLETFTDHAWIEIASGIFLYILLDIKFKTFGDVPVEDGERDYNYILDGISSSKMTVKIFDNDFASFFEDEKYNVSNYLKDRVREAFYKCIVNLESNQRIQILLLHPNTPAAQQRNEDLQDDNFDFYFTINEGLQFLQDFLDDLSKYVSIEMEMLNDKSDLKKLTDSKAGNYRTAAASKIALLIKNLESKSERERKINYSIEDVRKLIQKKVFEVKLFKTSFSVIFVSWDDNMNFSILPPKGNSSKRTFRTLKFTQLANYFIDNFEEVWAQEDKTISLEQYKKVIVKDVNDNTIGEYLPWGNDSHDHNIPVFICFEKSIQHIVKESKSKLFKIIHDDEMRWAYISEIETNENNPEPTPEKFNTKADFKPSSIYEFARKQIKVKSNYDVRAGQPIYQLKYLYRQDKITLADDEYVMKHLQLKGYCFTSFRKYHVQPGLQLMKSLNALYQFYIHGFDKHLLENGRTIDSYKRILTFYRANINEDGTVSINNFDISKELKWLVLSKEVMESDMVLNNFVMKTISADLYRIYGQRYKQKNNCGSYKTNGVGEYFIRVVFIKACVSEKEKIIPDFFDDGFQENKAAYTVLHFLGKKNILGGVPYIWVNKNIPPEREYNFHYPLDSIYFKSKYDSENRERLIEVDSSATHFFRFKEGDYGFRNLIAIEVFDKYSDLEKQLT